MGEELEELTASLFEVVLLLKKRSGIKGFDYNYILLQISKIYDGQGRYKHYNSCQGGYTKRI